jgi:serine/threonine protein kinase
LLYELCTGVRPFRGENLAAIFRAVTQDIPPEPAKIKPTISRGLSRIIMKCLSKKPDQRFQTCKAMVEALAGCFKAGEAILVTRPASKRILKNLVYAIAAILLVAGMGGGLAYHLVSTKQASETQQPAAKLAVIEVESKPPGAQIFLDKEFKGATPLELKIPAGRHEIRLALADYHEWEAKVQLPEKSVTPLLVRLLPIQDKQQ